MFTKTLSLSRVPTTFNRQLKSNRIRAMATASVTQDYETLSKKLKDISSLGGISGLLGWDEMVQMPAGAQDSRAAQKSALAAVMYEKSVDKEIGELLERLKTAKFDDEYQQAVVREAARDYKKSTAITQELVRKEAELETEGYVTWVKARQASDFSQFANVLQQWVDVKKERARLIDPTKPAYDVLADDYEKGMTAARLTEIFNQVKQGLVPLLEELRASSTKPDASWLKGEYDTEKQAALCKEIAVNLGFDLEKGRLDVSVHPFTGGAHPTDVRMTTRFKPDDVTEGITGAIHETGHALYEQGRNQKYDGLPVNSAAGMGIHESQSLLWERMVGLSLPFCRYLLPKLQEAFPENFNGKTPEQLYQALNVIKDPSMIRVESDEVTYPLHIIIRFEIERELIQGTIKVEDLAQIWKTKYTEYLGCTPATDAEGVLQDVHWSAGLFGYFPTYSLGAMCAVQIFEAAKKDLPSLEDDIAAGKFSGLKAWLNERVHAVGSLYPTADDLMVAVTGKPLDPSVFLDYLRNKYRPLYGLS